MDMGIWGTLLQKLYGYRGIQGDVPAKNAKKGI
jgi:hypothetical protein